MSVYMSIQPRDLDLNNDDCAVTLIHPPAVYAVRGTLAAMPPAAEVAGLFALSALKLVSALSGGELCVCDLAAATEINRSTVSHQLRTLREGQVIFYALEDDHVRRLLAMGIAHAGEGGR